MKLSWFRPSEKIEFKLAKALTHQRYMKRYPWRILSGR
jgi:hypothetical protein